MRRLALVLACGLFAAGFACSGSDGIEVTASFDDVGDLVPNAPVTMADINVGRVTDIRLVDNRALVTLSLDPEAKVPANTTARVRRTSVLGERIVDLVVAEDEEPSEEQLADGDEITTTVVRSDLEDLVQEGSDLLGAISASDFAVMIDEGGRGFGDRGEELRSLLNNFHDIVGAYAKKGEMIQSLISSANNFNTTIAAEADTHARSVASTQRSIEMLDNQAQRLERAIVALNRLARGGEEIFNDHLDEMQDFFRQTRSILTVLREEQGSLRSLLRWAPGHNLNTQLVEYTEFNQVVQDFVICGLNDNPKDPARTCKSGGH
jgi:phospholipid/cholesterol/gamma-HCH transport system substrate-binding protein